MPAPSALIRPCARVYAESLNQQHPPFPERLGVTNELQRDIGLPPRKGSAPTSRTDGRPPNTFYFERGHSLRGPRSSQQNTFPASRESKCVLTRRN